MRLAWDETGKHFFETGVDRGVLFPYTKGTNTYGKGVAWNGLTGVTESPEGAEANAIYADNIKYLNLLSAESLKATITAYTYPEEFEPMNGYAVIAQGATIGQQTRGMFGFAYRTLIGNDIDGQDHGYKIKLIYGCQAAPSEQAHSTVNDSPEAVELSWEVSTTPVAVAGFKPTASVDIDSTKCDPDKLAAFENILYGSSGSVAYNPVANPTPDSYTAASPTPDTYTEADMTGITDPKASGLYESDGEGGYVLTQDETVDGGKTYYTKTAGDNPRALGLYEDGLTAGTYVLTQDETVAVGKNYYTKTAGDNPNQSGWYEQSGTTYILTADTSVNTEKTYYTRVETGGSDPRLPLPDEIVTILGVAA